MAVSSPASVHIVSHTHWDREWYRPQHEFQVDLIPVVRAVLDRLEGDDTFHHFLLDGQSIIVEDYLRICPADEGRLRALAEDGSLAVGPWYVLPDEFLAGGEALVRNLLVGHQVAGRVGPVQKVGYTPDSFGHIAQLPQILRRAGIDTFVYTRGNGDEIDHLGLEYRWAAPDGSEVLAIHQYGGYCNGGELGYGESWHARTDRAVDVELAVEKLCTLIADLSERSRGDVVLVNNGCDHLPPQRDLGRIIAGLRDALPETEIVHGSLAGYVRAVREAHLTTSMYTGELLGARLQFILSGVWSTRMYLKQRNEYAQHLLAGYVEPVASYCHFLHGSRYPQGEIADAWRLLLQNHPHDSICGCSVDSVHRQMMTRFDGVTQTGEHVVRRLLDPLAPSVTADADGDERTVLCVVNPLPEPRTEMVQRVAVLRAFDGDVSALLLRDEAGQPVPCRIMNQRSVKRSWRFDFERELFWTGQRAGLADDRDDGARGTGADWFVTLQFLAELPPLGHANFVLSASQTGAAAGGSPEGQSAGQLQLVAVDGNVMENAFARVTVYGDGTFDLHDKSTDTIYQGLNRLEDTDDVGDEYDYAPCERSHMVGPDRSTGSVRVVEDTGFRAAVEAVFPFEIPAQAAGDRRSRTDAMVACPVTVRVALTCTDPLVEIDLWFENRAKDHRLRTMFPTPIETETVVSDGHFYVNHRPVAPPPGAEWMQPPPGTYPQQEFSLVQDRERGLAVFNRGLPEVAPFREPGAGTGLALTLLRAVGWLSRDDLSTRHCRPVGPRLATPDAQCLGEHHHEYAVVAFSGEDAVAGVKSLSRRYRTPAAVVQGVAGGAVAGGSLLRKETNRTCVSAVKRHEARDTLVVRLYNLTSEHVAETLHLGRRVAGAWTIDLLEERLSELEHREHRLALSLGPHEIATIELAFDGRRVSA